MAEITNSPYAYVWNDPVNYADPSGMMGERKGGPGDGKPDPKKKYGPKGGKLIDEVIIKGKKNYNAAHSFMSMSQDLDKGVKNGAADYAKDAYDFATKNAYSKSYWQNKGGEALMGAAFISDINKIRPDGSTNGMDLFNSASKASAYEVGHFAGYNGAQFATTAALTEGAGFLINSLKSSSIISNSKMNSQILSEAELQGFRSTNTGINPSIVNKYLNEMKMESFSNIEGVHGYLYNQIHTFTEGNHRINAAIQYKIQTGSYKYLDILMENATFDKQNPLRYYPKTYKFPVKPTR